MNRILYFDEAGFTGADLNSKSQPYFVLASALFSEEEIIQIKKEIDFDGLNVEELHFIKMKKNRQGRDLLKKLFSHPLMNDSHINFTYANKRYVIYAQIVDLLIETFMHYKFHEDLYKKHGGIVSIPILGQYKIRQ
jgi:hypothetical protein